MLGDLATGLSSADVRPRQERLSDEFTHPSALPYGPENLAGGKGFGLSHGQASKVFGSVRATAVNRPGFRGGRFI